MPSNPSASAYSSWSMYSWYSACPRTGSYSRFGMSTHTERYVCRKSSGKYGHGIRLNHVNFISIALSYMVRHPRYQFITVTAALESACQARLRGLGLPQAKILGSGSNSG